MKATLSVITVTALVLAAVTFGLGGIAQSNAQKEHIRLMETLLPGGTDFKKVPYDGEDTLISSVHKASQGYVIETVTNGYVDEIRMFIGVNNNGVVTGLVTYSAYETPGLGSKILTDHVFLSQFLNKSGNFSIGVSHSADAFSSATDTSEPVGQEIEVDGISGATVSSKAVAKSVSAAVAYVTGADIVSSATSWGG